MRPSDITVGEYAVRFHEEREHEFRSPLAWNREAYVIWQHFFGQGYERIRPASLNPAGVM